MRTAVITLALVPALVASAQAPPDYDFDWVTVGAAGMGVIGWASKASSC